MTRHCFDQSMHLYVDFEDRQMRDTVDRLIAEETWGSSEEEGPLGESEILTSASDLFIYIEEALKRCNPSPKCVDAPQGMIFTVDGQ